MNRLTRLFRSGLPHFLRTHTTLPSGQRHRTYFGLVVLYANTALLAHVFLTYMYTIKPTYGISMVPTINPVGNWILISKRHRRGRRISVGDLVCFKHPLLEGEGAVKRVVGMPGDFVLSGTPGVGDERMVQVPEGHCWVAGDNQMHSRDSRYFGPLPLALVRGKVIAHVLPLSKMGWINNGLQEPWDPDSEDFPEE